MLPSPAHALLPLVLAGCLPAGTYPLTPLDPSASASVISAAQLDYAPSQGWDLTVVLTLRNPSADQTRRYDLASAWVRADEGAWAPCHHPDGTDQDLLIFALGPGEERQRTLQCQPSSALKRASASGLRFMSSAAALRWIAWEKTGTKGSSPRAEGSRSFATAGW